MWGEALLSGETWAMKIVHNFSAEMVNAAMTDPARALGFDTSGN